VEKQRLLFVFADRPDVISGDDLDIMENVLAVF
jgi:hypothetical protein